MYLSRRNDSLDARILDRASINTFRPHLCLVSEGRIYYTRELLGKSTYQQAVDSVTEFQRVVQGGVAWAEMANRLLDDRHWTNDQVGLRGVGTADDSFIGVGINGITKYDVLWLIKEKVPCFIIHEFSPTTSRQYSSIQRCRGFLEGSDAGALRPDVHGYDFVARS